MLHWFLWYQQCGCQTEKAKISKSKQICVCTLPTVLGFYNFGICFKYRFTSLKIVSAQRYLHVVHPSLKFYLVLGFSLKHCPSTFTLVVPNKESLCNVNLETTLWQRLLLMNFHFLHISKAIFQCLNVSTWKHVKHSLCNNWFKKSQQKIKQQAY